MQLRVCRSASVAACVAALAAAAAGSAQAAVVPVTGLASSVTATTASLNGTVTTNGKLTQWQFAYAVTNNPFQGGFTPGAIIPSGTSTATPVSGLASGLTPSTTYTYYLVATDVTFGVSYYLLSPQYGMQLTFTTKGPGSASLASTKLKVKKGRVAVPIKCSKALACSGGVLAITARHKHKSVGCGTASFNVNAGKKKTIKTSKISKRCRSLLMASAKRSIKAKLVASFTYQKGISKTVTLKLVP